MTPSINATVECELIGEFTDDASALRSTSEMLASNGEIVSTNILAEFTDDAAVQFSETAAARNFVVLLKSYSHAITVRGHEVNYLSQEKMGSATSFAIVAREGDEEIIVAMFPMSEVIGIYEGDPANVPVRTTA